MQNYQNHLRFVFGFHVILFGILLLTFVGSNIQLWKAYQASNLLGALPVWGLSLSFFFMFFYARIFALKAQDRAIRAEENLRHFVLTGKLLDSRLHIRQVIALRFAPDEEFVELAKKSAEERLAPNDIKKAIKNWKPDTYRV